VPPCQNVEVQRPRTQYVQVDGLNIAYQVVGGGPVDLVNVPGFVSNCELAWDEPLYARFLERLASFSRLIMFDKRGTGMSDRVAPDRLPSLEERMHDLVAVLDVVGSNDTVLFSHSEGGNLAVLFAATYPQRARALITAGIFAKRVWSEDYPWAPTPDQRAESVAEVERNWGGTSWLVDLAPSCAHDDEYKERLATYFRRSASPGAAAALFQMNTSIDIRSVLPAISAPTLVLHRTGDRDANVEEGRWIASRIPGARFVELPGDDHIPWVGDTDQILDLVEEFVTGTVVARVPERRLTTLLFTDIVGSTRTAVDLGDRKWRELLQRYEKDVRAELAHYRGQEIDTAGDGFLASFDGPARAIEAAIAIRAATQKNGLQLRTGIHTGEVEIHGDKFAGVAVHVAARVLAAALPGQILVSRTVRDLISGSGLVLDDAGEHLLKGIDEQWRLFAVAV
jgi:class 3 adenylate cyclase